MTAIDPEAFCQWYLNNMYERLVDNSWHDFHSAWTSCCLYLLSSDLKQFLIHFGNSVLPYTVCAVIFSVKNIADFQQAAPRQATTNPISVDYLRCYSMYDNICSKITVLRLWMKINQLRVKKWTLLWFGGVARLENREICATSRNMKIVVFGVMEQSVKIRDKLWFTVLRRDCWDAIVAGKFMRSS